MQTEDNKEVGMIQFYPNQLPGAQSRMEKSKELIEGGQRKISIINCSISYIIAKQPRWFTAGTETRDIFQGTARQLISVRVSEGLRFKIKEKIRNYTLKYHEGEETTVISFCF